MNDKVEDIYPLTIIKDRYNGSYSRGKYLAFNVDHWDIADKIGGSDTDEMNYWDIEDSSYMVGKGDTIELSVLNLLEKINER